MQQPRRAWKLTLFFLGLALISAWVGGAFESCSEIEKFYGQCHWSRWSEGWKFVTGVFGLLALAAWTYKPLTGG